MIAGIPLHRLGRPEDIVNVFVFLALDEASDIAGVVLRVDGMARAQQDLLGDVITESPAGLML